MSVKDSAKPSGVSGSWIVLGLFAMVVVLFVVLFYGSRPRINGSSEGSPEAVTSAQAFVEAMNSGKNYFDQGKAGAGKAIEQFRQAVALNGGDEAAALNLANAYLLNNQAAEAAEAAASALAINRQSPAGYYLLGCSLLRSSRFEDGLKAFQTAKELDHTINEVSYQMGRAHQGLGQWEAAAEQFREVIQFDAEHGAVYYNLSQVLIRLGDEAGAEQALAQHQVISEKNGATVTDPSVFEQCLYTEARVPFQLEQPDLEGITVAFREATGELLGDVAASYVGPVAVLDVGQDGTLDLVARNPAEGFQLLLQKEGLFVPEGFPYPALEGAAYQRCLVGDLQHKGSLMGGRQEDFMLLSDQGTQVFRVSPSGMLSDSSLFAQIAGVVLEEAVVHDLDLTGKLDLIGLNATNRSLMFFRNQGNFSFIDQTSSTNLPTHIEGIHQFVFDDWDGDDRLDLFLALPDQAPSLWLRQRGGGFVETNLLSRVPPSRGLVVGDVNNDLRMDVVSLGSRQLHLTIQGDEEGVNIGDELEAIRRIDLWDFDNDGWLDILGSGGGRVRVWRNRGLEGFTEVTTRLGLSELDLGGEIGAWSFADLDNDCDTDLLLTLADQSIKVLRNDGGNQNQQLKIRLEGTRSNPSGLGVKLEVTSGGLRMMRTVHSLPIEIGMGQRQRVDAIDPHWSDLVTTTDFEIEGCSPLSIPELELPTGSCPYVYVGDGRRHRFVTDLLGAAPLGLPVAEGVLIPADTDEYVWLGNRDHVGVRDGRIDVRITEELREVLYLDQAKLVVVDHPPMVEIYPTSKLVPGPPFPEHRLVALRRLYNVVRATRSDGQKVTARLLSADQQVVSPVALRAPQLRGLAEPYHIDLDFGKIDVSRPLVLAMHGWLRFGGGMANMGASHHPDLPFPFPVLTAEVSDGRWVPVDVTVGAPAGKTKAMMVDLTGKLPPATKRLRLATAFEIHWDRIALMERYHGDDVVMSELDPEVADLHWRGFSTYRDLPWDRPLTPDYDRLTNRAPWLITPSGWCTRYGDVGELVASKDDRLVLMNGGDELTLQFDESQAASAGGKAKRDYFLFTSGWDKDADPHVVQGGSVGPLPWHGQDDQLYGLEERPPLPTDGWQERYNTRWVGPFTLRRKTVSARMSDSNSWN